jgi:hypothetical protein
MSYSFSVTSDTKADACGKIREQFDAVVVAQPYHAADKEAAVVAAQAMVRILDDPSDGHEIHVSMHGSLSWRYDVPEKYINASVGISVSLRAKSEVK